MTKMIYRAGEYIAIGEKIARADMEKDYRTSYEYHNKLNKMLSAETVYTENRAYDIYIKAYNELMNLLIEFNNETSEDILIEKIANELIDQAWNTFINQPDMIEGAINDEIIQDVASQELEDGTSITVDINETNHQSYLFRIEAWHHQPGYGWTEITHDLMKLQ